MHEKLEHRFEAGGLEEAFLRALIYIRLPEGSIDERGFNMLKIIRESRKAGERLDNQKFKDILREQLNYRARPGARDRRLAETRARRKPGRRKGAGSAASHDGRPRRAARRRSASTCAGRANVGQANAGLEGQQE